MAKHRTPDASPPEFAARAPLEEAQAAFDAADLALNQARTNLATLRDRKARMDDAMAEAGAEVRAASAGLASAEPSAERVYDDAVRALTTTQQRLEALREHAVPGAEAAVKRCLTERDARRDELQRQEVRAVMLAEVLPADRAVHDALDAAAAAVEAAEAARHKLQARLGFANGVHPALHIGFLSWGASGCEG